MGRDLMVALFATTAGFTVSGILANLYRLIVKKPDNNLGRGAYYAVMVIAGPNVLLENAAAKLREKSCSKWAFWLAAAISAYWSFAIGLFVLNIYIAMR
ncbi:MAG TPA: hypothetical protein VI075_06840 [Methyloceanibacter sp.]|jgi:Family of unknown function (DUF6949)